ncbi:MAG: hypothetical protein ACRCYM_02690 [Cetobacterium sp.]
MSKKYSCKKCGTYIGELKESGYIEYNSKNKYASNASTTRVTCNKCKEIIYIKR